jgi:mitochondrial chaperone BCS1
VPSILSNQLVGGGLVLMLTGGVMGLLRNVPSECYYWLKKRFTVNLTILDSDPLFEWTKLWLDSLPYSKRTRRVSCSLHREVDKDFSTDSKPVFSPSPGNHFFRHNGKLIWLERAKPEAPTSGSAAGKRTPESITLTLLGTDQGCLRILVEEIIKAAKAEEKINAFVSGSGWWRKLPSFSPRHISTVDLPWEDETRVIEAIKEFLVSRADYTTKGIPYHLNFLFAGLPGTGKTSLAAALSGHFGLHLHILNIAGPGMNDDNLIDLMLSLPRRSMLLLEDVDAVAPTRNKPKKSKKSNDVLSTDNSDDGVTLSGLLNCMDGITAPDGAIIIMTTNHPENLDAALLRPGRVDIRLNFGEATREQIERMCKRLNPPMLENGKVDALLADKLTAAQVQAVLMESR